MLRIFAALSLAALALAQEPTFRAGTRLVQVDVVVHNKNGAVTGLQKSDFTILDEGKPQPITVFSVTTSSRQPAETSTPLPPGAVSNQRNKNGEPLSTATILLIDRLDTPVNDQFYANQKILKFLQDRGSHDRLGIYVLGSNIRVVQELTDDPERLDRAVKGLKPQDARRFTADITVDPTGDPTADQMIANSLSEMRKFAVEDRVGAVREALIAIAHHLAKVPGRKNLIWVSGSFPLIIILPHEVIDFSKDVDAAARALNDANVAVYPVDARGLVGNPAGIAENGAAGGRPNCYTQGVCVGTNAPSGPNGLDTMNTLAGLTGGIAYYNTNGIEDSIRKATEDAVITYTLGFSPDDDSFDDKFHKLSVKVDRKGVDVRFRKGYFATRQQQTSQETVDQLLRSPLDATAVGITAEAKRDPGQPGHINARIIVDARTLQLEHRDGVSSGSIDVSLYVDGARSVFSLTRRFEVPDSQLASVLQSGVEVPASIDVPEVKEGTRDLRVVVQDKATGAAGSLRLALR